MDLTCFSQFSLISCCCVASEEYKLDEFKDPQIEDLEWKSGKHSERRHFLDLTPRSSVSDTIVAPITDVQSLKLAVELSPTSWEARFKLGNALIGNTEEFEETLRHLHYAVALNPSYMPSYFALGFCYHSRGDFSNAAEVFEHALLRDNRNVELWTGLGSAYASEGKVEEAFRAYRNALRLDPYHVMTCYNLANLYYDVGDVDHAIILYLECLNINPAHTDACFNLGVAYQAASDEKNSKKFFLMAEKLESSGQKESESKFACNITADRTQMQRLRRLGPS